MAQVAASLGLTQTKGRTTCPVHQGKNKNFKMRGRFGTCFSQCGGKSWDTVELLQELRSYTYPEALNELARIGGVDVERTERQTPEEIARFQEVQRHKASLADNLKLALDLYPRPAVLAGDKYDFEGRTLGQETIDAFDLMISPPQRLGAGSRQAREGRPGSFGGTGRSA